MDYQPYFRFESGVYQCRSSCRKCKRLLSQEILIAVFGAGEVVHFEEPNLEAAVKDALGFIEQTKDIYEGDLIVLNTLECKFSWH
jgi:hypothetical protein